LRFVRAGGIARTMNDKASKPPAPMTREERLAAKLRENLRRRKAQARALDTRPRGEDGGDEDGAAHENESGRLSKSPPES
jgi:hypothetical protein